MNASASTRAEGFQIGWMMRSTEKTLRINLVIALGVMGVRVYFTEFFGYAISPVLVDAVAFLLVLILAVVTYVKTDRDKKTLLFFLPLFAIAFMPILFLAATFAAWSIGGFSP